MTEADFSATQRQASRAQVDHDIALQERAEEIARLRALRMAKEARDKERVRDLNASRTPGT